MNKDFFNEIANNKNVAQINSRLEETPEDTVNFAVASSVMKHAIRGDTNITCVDHIKRLMKNSSFDVQR